MGQLELPTSGSIYLDTSPVIYSVERIAPYEAIMRPVWENASERRSTLISSELLLLETLVKPVRIGNEKLESIYRTLLTESHEFRLYSIDSQILNQAIQLRATIGLKTPDAIHAATAIQTSCTLFLTNDSAFKRIPNLNVAVLSEYV